MTRESIWDSATNGSHNLGQKTTTSDYEESGEKKTKLCHPREPLSENQRKLKERQVPGPCQRTEITLKYEGGSDTNSNWRA